MITVKIITGINWVLIGMYGVAVIWAFLQKANPYNDAGGSQMEATVKGLGVFLLLLVIGLNLLPYQWTKFVALLLTILLLLLVFYIATN